MTYEPSYTMWYCEECKGSRPCYCLMESVFTPQLCIDERGPEGAVWNPMTYEPSYTMWYCEECKGSRPCYCLMESVFTPQLCINERGPEGAVWNPLLGRVAQNVFGQLNISDVKYYEARESE